jgi:hypothetical protein
MKSNRYSCQILIKLEFFSEIRKNTQISNFTNIRSLGAELFHTDRHDTANSLFRKFANAPKNCYIIALFVVMRHLRNFSKLSYSSWQRIVMLVQHIVTINDFSLHSVKFVSIFCHPKQMS